MVVEEFGGVGLGSEGHMKAHGDGLLQEHQGCVEGNVKRGGVEYLSHNVRGTGMDETRLMEVPVGYAVGNKGDVLRRKRGGDGKSVLGVRKNVGCGKQTSKSRTGVGEVIMVIKGICCASETVMVEKLMLLEDHDQSEVRGRESLVSMNESFIIECTWVGWELKKLRTVELVDEPEDDRWIWNGEGSGEFPDSPPNGSFLLPSLK
ncbi:hypothetical protein VNO78_34698 [Psophocarpus tetragonolobus]|uniref:Uncharacterized protein n=1 Tax=Psophocarpus tetragonolobus TaxID=3891 RepID=A0AAN9NNT8_PSOTE